MQIKNLPENLVKKFLPREFDISAKIHHVNVLEVYDIFRSNDCFYIFMEFAGHGLLIQFHTLCFLMSSQCLEPDASKRTTTKMLQHAGCTESQTALPSIQLHAAKAIRFLQKGCQQ